MRISLKDWMKYYPVCKTGNNDMSHTYRYELYVEDVT